MSIRDERKRQSHQAIIDAALRLSTSGRSFNSITLREISREIGLVPSAFYRHFKDMDALGLELIDNVSLHFKTILHQLGQTFSQQQLPSAEKCFDLFFHAIEQHQKEWIFLISERWGGSEYLRRAISREMEYLNEDLTIHLKHIPHIQHINDAEDIKNLADLIMNLAFNWAITWISYLRQFEYPVLASYQTKLKQQALMQLDMIYNGLSHWKNNAP